MVSGGGGAGRRGGLGGSDGIWAAGGILVTGARVLWVVVERFGRKVGGNGGWVEVGSLVRMYKRKRDPREVAEECVAWEWCRGGGRSYTKGKGVWGRVRNTVAEGSGAEVGCDGGVVGGILAGVIGGAESAEDEREFVGGGDGRAGGGGVRWGRGDGGVGRRVNWAENGGNGVDRGGRGGFRVGFDSWGAMVEEGGEEGMGRCKERGWVVVTIVGGGGDEGGAVGMVGEERGGAGRERGDCRRAEGRWGEGGLEWGWEGGGGGMVSVGLGGEGMRLGGGWACGGEDSGANGRWGGVVWGRYWEGMGWGWGDALGVGAGRIGIGEGARCGCGGGVRGTGGPEGEKGGRCSEGWVGGAKGWGIEGQGYGHSWEFCWNWGRLRKGREGGGGCGSGKRGVGDLWKGGEGCVGDGGCSEREGRSGRGGRGVRVKVGCVGVEGLRGRGGMARGLGQKGSRIILGWNDDEVDVTLKSSDSQSNHAQS
ncbi:hypothetical protein Tco_1226503 [Tanacetum coccineum]